MRRLFVASVIVGCAQLWAGCGSTSPPAVVATFTAQPKPRFLVYYVEMGDSLISIGRIFGVPWPKILASNSCEPGNLRPGLPLLIPLHERTTRPQGRLPKNDVLPRAAARDTLVAVPRTSLHRGKPRSRYWWPTRGSLVRRYNDRVRGLNEPGIGLAAPLGTEVCAVADGEVVAGAAAGRSPRPGWGNVLCVRHAGGIVSWYGSLDRMTVGEGDRVRRGQRIGTVGDSGAAAAPELALRLFKDERPVDPLGYLP